MEFTQRATLSDSFLRWQCCCSITLTSHACQRSWLTVYLSGTDGRVCGAFDHGKRCRTTDFPRHRSTPPCPVIPFLLFFPCRVTTSSKSAIINSFGCLSFFPSLAALGLFRGSLPALSMAIWLVRVHGSASDANCSSAVGAAWQLQRAGCLSCKVWFLSARKRHLRVPSANDVERWGRDKSVR